MVEAAGIETSAVSTESLWFHALGTSRGGVRPECWSYQLPAPLDPGCYDPGALLADRELMAEAFG